MKAEVAVMGSVPNKPTVSVDVKQHFNQPISSDDHKACRSVIGTGLAVVQALLERGSRVRVPVKRSLMVPRRGLLYFRFWWRDGPG